MDTPFIIEHLWLVPLVITLAVFMRAAWTIIVRHFPREETVDAEEFIAYINATVISVVAWVVWAVVNSLVQ